MNKRVVLLVVAVMVAAVGGGLSYWIARDPLGFAQVSPRVAGKEASSAMDEALMERLRKMEQAPGDAVGWALLARSFAEAGRHADAVPMYEKAMKQIPNDPQLLADYADALGMVQGRRLEGKPHQLIQQALTIDPNHVKALRLAGTAAFDRKEYEQAVRYWKRADANLPNEGASTMEVRQELQAAIAEAEALAKGSMTEMKKAGAVPVSETSGKSGMAISGTVSLAPHLSGKQAPTDTLFVFARGVSGPPMPVAIVRMATWAFPVAFSLDDRDSPMPTRKLSEAGDVVIVARLSKSGEAMPRSGDLEGVSRVVRPGARQVAVVIDRELP